MKNKISIDKIKKNFKKINKVDISDELNFYVLYENEADIITEFIEENVSDFSRNMYVKQDVGHIKRVYNRGGFAIGCYNKDTLISVMCVDLSMEESKFKKINSRTIIPTKNSVVFDTVVVKPEYSNKHLASVMMILGEYLSIEKGYENAFCTISPYNYFSVTNAVNSGFYIYAIIDMYGDKKTSKNSVKRYLAHLPLGKVRADVEEQYAVKCLDFKMQQEVLDLGFCGFKTINFKNLEDYFLSFSMMYYD